MSDPSQAAAASQLRTRAGAAFGAGHAHAAESDYEALLAMLPGDFEALVMLGTLAARSGRAARAAEHFALAESSEPTSPVPPMNLGIVLTELGEPERALAAFDRALALAPGLAEAHCNRGVPLERLGRRREALASYERAIEIEPHFVRAHNNRGSVLLALGEPEAALAAYERAMTVDPGHSRTYSKRGAALIELGRPAEALESYARAIALDRGNAEAYWNAALCHLAAGRYAEGWRLYEWRKRLPVPIANRALAQPLWNGAQPLAGRSIYVYSEQGLGDTLQFCRYVPELARRGARVVFAVQRPLRRLLTTLAGVAELCDEAADAPVTDYQIPLLSLPLALGGGAPLDGGAYLAAEETRIARWRARLPAAKLRVGIAWAGNATHLDLGRFFPLAALAPLGAIPGVVLVSLQKGPGTEQLADLDPSLPVTTLGEDFDADGDAFVDSAAVLANLDLLVTPDTALAHLAGALGRPACVVLRHAPDWRWGTSGERCDWYATARLFRQPARGDWRGAIAALAAALAAQVR